MAKLGKRTGRGGRPGGGKRSRGGGAHGANSRQPEPRVKGPSRTMAKEENAKKRRAAMRQQRFARGVPADADSYMEREEPDADSDAYDSGSASGSDDRASDDEEGPHSAYGRLMQALNKTAADGSASDAGGEEESDDEESDGKGDNSDEDEEELEWEEVSSNDEDEAGQDEDEDGEEEVDDEDEDDDDDDDQIDGGRRPKTLGRKKGKTDDPEADRDELGLDADAPESDDDEEEAPAKGKQGGAAATEPKGGFYDHFLANISAEQAAEAEKLRAGGKWKRQEVAAGSVRGFLWRKGSVGASALPHTAAYDASLEEICAPSTGVAALFKTLAEKSAGKRKGAEERRGSGGGCKGGGGGRSEVSGLSELQRALMPQLDAYMDVQFSARTPGEVAVSGALCMVPWWSDVSVTGWLGGEVAVQVGGEVAVWVGEAQGRRRVWCFGGVVLVCVSVGGGGGVGSSSWGHISMKCCHMARGRRRPCTLAHLHGASLDSRRLVVGW